MTIDGFEADFSSFGMKFGVIPRVADLLAVQCVLEGQMPETSRTGMVLELWPEIDMVIGPMRVWKFHVVLNLEMVGAAIMHSSGMKFLLNTEDVAFDCRHYKLSMYFIIVLFYKLYCFN